MNCDTRLSAAVLEELGFQKHPEKPQWLMRRHGHFLVVVEMDDGGWMLDGFRPVDVGAGQNYGRLLAVEGFLDTIEGPVVLNWARTNGLLPKVEVVTEKAKPKKTKKK